MVVFFVIGMQFSGFDNKSIITGAINRTVDANPVGPLGLPPSFSWVCFMMFLFHLYEWKVSNLINLLFPEYLVNKCFIIPKDTSYANKGTNKITELRTI